MEKKEQWDSRIRLVIVLCVRSFVRIQALLYKDRLQFPGIDRATLISGRFNFGTSNQVEVLDKGSRSRSRRAGGGAGTGACIKQVLTARSLRLYMLYGI